MTTQKQRCPFEIRCGGDKTGPLVICTCEGGDTAHNCQTVSWCRCKPPASATQKEKRAIFGNTCHGGIHDFPVSGQSCACGEAAPPASATAQGKLAVDDRLYPCGCAYGPPFCRVVRTKAEGGTTFTHCDYCWNQEEHPHPDPSIAHKRAAPLPTDATAQGRCRYVYGTTGECGRVEKGHDEEVASHGFLRASRPPEDAAPLPEETPGPNDCTHDSHGRCSLTSFVPLPEDADAHETITVHKVRDLKGEKWSPWIQIWACPFALSENHVHCTATISGYKALDGGEKA